MEEESGLNQKSYPFLFSLRTWGLLGNTEAGISSFPTVIERSFRKYVLNTYLWWGVMMGWG